MAASNVSPEGLPDRPTCAYIGLGSNLGGPVRQVQRALEALTRIPRTRPIGHSALYRSRPLGTIRQPDFVNAVAALDTRLAAPALLSYLHRIEREQGRVRSSVRWGPRTLDLDLLLFGDSQIQSRELILPHPGLHRRSFVLYPLHEIAPDLRIPGRGTLVELLRTVSRDGLERLDA